MDTLSGSFVVVDKPPGPTSHDVVAHCRRVFKTREVGHAGTLDPFASGVVVVLMGAATRLADTVGEGRKGYLAVAHLGVETTTDDLTGEVTFQSPGTVSDQALRHALADLQQQRWQVPPAYSAKHIHGRRAYELARAGEVVDLPPAQVQIDAVELVGRDGPSVTFRVECGRGTYIRSMARDLGRSLGVGAHLVSLKRTSVGGCSLEHAVAMEQLEAGSARSSMELLAWVPSAVVPRDHASALLKGASAFAGKVGSVAWATGKSGVVGDGRNLVAVARSLRDLSPAGPVGPADLQLGRRFPCAQGPDQL